MSREKNLIEALLFVAYEPITLKKLAEISQMDNVKVKENEAEQPEICESCKAGTIGCVACKKRLAAKLDEFMAPIRERREHFAAQPKLLDEVLADGRAKAAKSAGETIKMVKEVMGLK